MTRFAHGLVLGKFYPPHVGHHHLIKAAAAACEQVTVLVEASAVESIPLAHRVDWLRAEHAGEPVTVLGARCDVPVDMADPQVWAAQVAVMAAALRVAGRPAVDAVFTGETYGDELGARLGAVHVCVDRRQEEVSFSGTQVRADLAAAWPMLAPAVRAGLATRVVVVGSESTGTTTTARRLAEHYSTVWVSEYGRELTLARIAGAGRVGGGGPGREFDEVLWTSADFAHIAEEQTRRENAAAGSSPLLICDTDAFATAVWERRYLGEPSRASAPWAGPLLPRRDLYLVTDHVGVPFTQDGIRDGEAVRAEMTTWFVDALTEAGHPWVLLTGTEEQRWRLALRSVDATLRRTMRFAEPLN